MSPRKRGSLTLWIVAALAVLMIYTLAIPALRGLFYRPPMFSSGPDRLSEREGIPPWLTQGSHPYDWAATNIPPLKLLLRRYQQWYLEWGYNFTHEQP
ncbi:hypothetical protein DES53_102798 [Roseimicrobium gellanilyticum]|uniref:Uncharacterized protein n=1 Tax=Roseimicrobium gellanilyticum TaxID=748857 RepID=A0A366HUM7_9BACT|nr:hypothetical protein [Roseimicrobium gellanilyticum]RBP46407.1 hypothetical protein DES53_102798 [Roseimicrobium gellanilyticum]